jgi:hypothetical protein
MGDLIEIFSEKLPRAILYHFRACAQAFELFFVDESREETSICMGDFLFWVSDLKSALMDR